jgi:predicted nucleic acid-binding protein
VAEIWVPNASPMIVLAKVGRLQLVKDLCDEVLLPQPVASEILAGPTDDPARLAVAAGWGTRVFPGQCPLSLVEWGLGVGETAVLAVALERRPCTALLDDAAARAAARTFGIPTLGTLGILVRAKMRGMIASTRPAVQDVREAGLYLDDSSIAAALRRIGEEW